MNVLFAYAKVWKIKHLNQCNCEQKLAYSVLGLGFFCFCFKYSGTEVLLKLSEKSVVHFSRFGY